MSYNDCDYNLDVRTAKDCPFYVDFDKGRCACRRYDEDDSDKPSRKPENLKPCEDRGDGAPPSTWPGECSLRACGMRIRLNTRVVDMMDSIRNLRESVRHLAAGDDNVSVAKLEAAMDQWSKRLRREI